MAATKNATSVFSNALTGNVVSASAARATGEGLLCAVWQECDFASVGSAGAPVWDAAGDNQAFTAVANQQEWVTVNRKLSLFVLPAPTTAKTGNVDSTLTGGYGGATTHDRASMLVVRISAHDAADMIRASNARQEGVPETNDFPNTVTSAVGDLVLFFGSARENVGLIDAGDLSGFEEFSTAIGSRTIFVGTKAGAAGTTTGTALYNDPTGQSNALIAVSIKAGAAPAPVITGPSGAAGAASININVAENSTALGIWTTTGGGVLDIFGGADAAQVQMVAGVASFIANNNDFENPDDAGTNRVYNFTVRSVAPGGTTTQDVVATLTNATELPGTPTIGTATAGNATVTVPFTAPSAGTAPSVIDYTVTLSPGGAAKIVSASPAVFTSADGVVNGTAYTGTVTARNSDGTGSASAASNSVTPAAVAYTCSILDWVLPTASQHALGEQWNISFHNPSTRALVANFPSAALVAGVNGAGQACRNLVASSTSFVPGTTYAWFATHPTNPTWFAVGLATAA